MTYSHVRINNVVGYFKVSNSNVMLLIKVHELRFDIHLFLLNRSLGLDEFSGPEFRSFYDVI